MKKIFTIMLFTATLSFNAASAQSRNDRNENQDYYEVTQPNNNRDFNRLPQSEDYGYNNRNDRNNEYNRQKEYDRPNGQYDRRNDGYKKDDPSKRYERNRQVQQAEQERQQKTKTFANGMVVGGIAAILIGVLIGSGK